jgi:hypothetical protein
MYAHRSALAAGFASHHLALGGGGLGHFIVRLFIWHEIARVIRYLWHIPTFGPFIVIGLGVVVVGLFIWRRARGPVRWGGRGSGPFWGRRRGGSTGYGSGGGPRDW